MLPRFRPLDGVAYHISLVTCRHQGVGQVWWGWAREPALAAYDHAASWNSHARRLLVLEVDGQPMIYFAGKGNPLCALEIGKPYLCTRAWHAEIRQHVWQCVPT